MHKKIKLSQDSRNDKLVEGTLFKLSQESLATGTCSILHLFIYSIFASDCKLIMNIDYNATSYQEMDTSNDYDDHYQISYDDDDTWFTDDRLCEITKRLLQGFIWLNSSCPHDAMSMTLLVLFFHTRTKNNIKVRFDETFPQLTIMFRQYLCGQMDHEELKRQFVNCLTEDGSKVPIGSFYDPQLVIDKLQKKSLNKQFMIDTSYSWYA